MSRIVRETAFRLVRRDVMQFLEDHEEDLMRIFREEMQKLDNRLPEEELFIDIRIVALGEVMMQAALVAIKRFLEET